MLYLKDHGLNEAASHSLHKVSEFDQSITQLEDEGDDNLLTLDKSGLSNRTFKSDLRLSESDCE